MKIRRVISLVLVLLFISQCFTFVRASDISTEDMGPVVYDGEEYSGIRELLALRNSLETNYKENEALIARIDLKLERLGAEEVSSAEIMEKLGVASPEYYIPSTTDIKWVSTRLVTTYNGQHYEVQIYDGIPNCSTSRLIDDNGICRYDADGLIAGIAKAIRIVGADGAQGAIEHITNSQKLKTGLTILDVILTANDVADEIKQSLSTSTVFKNINGVALVSFSTHMQYVFVKPYQTSDQQQLLYSVGNITSCHMTTVAALWKEGDSEPVSEHLVREEHSSSQSNYYDDYTHAVKKCHDYRPYGITEFNPMEYQNTIDIEFYSEIFTLDIPIVTDHT